MTKMRVWAPRALAVELAGDEVLLPMTMDRGGWWNVEAPFIEHDGDYSFRVDGEGPFPDPRSPWQPEGVHGPSRWVDHSRFLWTDTAWQPPPLASAVIYELHVGTFTPRGTFEAVIDRLNHLKELGVTYLELMPVGEFSGRRGWGYDGVDLYAPHHAYGGPEGLKALVDACHREGLAVLLDVVYNHLGPAGNYLERFGPYFTDRYRTPWGQAINFDGPESDEVRRFFIDNALMWLKDYHLDGLRIDAVHAILDLSAIHFLEQLAREVKELEAHLGRRFVLIAESDLNDPRAVRSLEAGGYGLQAQWNEDFHHALHAALTGEVEGYYRDFGRLADLAKILTRGFAYDGCYSLYRRRRHGRSARGISGHRFVGFLQNHDQVGNRAKGERTGRLMSDRRLKMGAALVLTSPFVPLLFQGEEWGASAPFLYFTDHQDPELAEAVRRGRRQEFSSFGWRPEEVPDPQDPETFNCSRLNWEEIDREPHRSILAWHRRLIQLRRQLPVLTDGRLDLVEASFDEERKWLVLIRGPLILACNLADRTQRVSLGPGRPCCLAAKSESPTTLEEGMVELPPEGVAILTVS